MTSKRDLLWIVTRITDGVHDPEPLSARGSLTHSPPMTSPPKPMEIDDTADQGKEQSTSVAQPSSSSIPELRCYIRSWKQIHSPN